MSQDSEDEARRTRRHELRTPLNQILGYSELLHEDATEKGEVSLASDLEKIQAAARRMLELIEDIVSGVPPAPLPPGRATMPAARGLPTPAPPSEPTSARLLWWTTTS
jgi:hypothetical protein